jgi:hypothetical protein
MSQNTTEQSFDVSLPARLKVSNICGSVVIAPGESGTIRVRAVKHSEQGDAEHTEILFYQEPDGEVVAKTRFEHLGFWGWLTGSSPCAVDYTIEAPKATSVTASGVSNSLELRGLDGEFTLGTVSGDMKLAELTGPLEVRSVSGQVRAERLHGPLKLNTVSGDLDARASAFSSIYADTVSGEMDVETGVSAGPYQFKSVSGGVRLRLPPDAHCSVELSTVSGSISAGLPAHAQPRASGKQRADLNGGGLLIAARSVSGDVRLDPAENLPPTVDRRTVLEQLARGEIDAEQAAQQLAG